MAAAADGSIIEIFDTKAAFAVVEAVAAEGVAFIVAPPPPLPVIDRDAAATAAAETALLLFLLVGESTITCSRFL